VIDGHVASVAQGAKRVRYLGLQDVVPSAMETYSRLGPPARRLDSGILTPMSAFKAGLVQLLCSGDMRC